MLYAHTFGIGVLLLLYWRLRILLERRFDRAEVPEDLLRLPGGSSGCVRGYGHVAESASNGVTNRRAIFRRESAHAADEVGPLLLSAVFGRENEGNAF